MPADVVQQTDSSRGCV